MSDVDDCCWRAARVRSSEELRDQFNRFLRGGESDANRFLICQRFETLEREREMSAAFVVGNGVNLIDDDGFNVTQELAALLRSEQDVERLRRGDQNVWWTAQHLLAISRQSVAGSHEGPDFRHQQAALCGKLHDFAQRA